MPIIDIMANVTKKIIKKVLRRLIQEKKWPQPLQKNDIGL